MTEKKLANKSIKELQQDIENQKLSIIQKEKEEQILKRKERTRRLIRKGALVEKIFSLYDFSVEETETFLTDIYNKLN